MLNDISSINEKLILVGMYQRNLKDRECLVFLAKIFAPITGKLHLKDL